MVESYIVYILLAFLGLFFGSFLNVLADRLSMGRTLFGRSKCDACHREILWYDLFPIISYVLLKAKCRHCKASLSIQYPLSELFTSAMFVLTYYLSVHHYNQDVLHFVHLVIVAILVVMFLSDMRYQIIPDEMQVALLVAALVRIYFLVIPGFEFVEVRTYLLGAAAVVAPLLLVFVLTKGRGMGFGDVKYAVSMGLLLGLWNGIIALYLAFILGGLVGGAILLARKGTMKSKIAFGPFLFAGTYAMLFYDVQIVSLLSLIYGF